jgi:hypothetical protein
MIEPLWYVKSGEFFGWRSQHLLYTPKGVHAGYFVNDVCYLVDGQYVGEIYPDDPKRFGIRASSHRSSGNTQSLRSGLNPPPPIPDPIVRMSLAEWLDPVIGPLGSGRFKKPIKVV